MAAAYAAPMVPMQMLWEPLLSSVPALYARYGALSLTELGATVLAMRLLDVALDGAIGLASDRTRSRRGRRKPWIVAGAAIALPAAWALFAVPHDAGILYFATAMGFASLGWSMVAIPHAAWLGDLTRDEGGRGTLAGWRVAAASAGSLLFIAIPLLPRFADAAMTPAVLGVARLAIAVLLPPAVLAAMLFLPAGGGAGAARASILASLRALVGSRPMRLLCIALLLQTIASGMVAACYFFYLEVRLGVGGAFGAIGAVTYLAALAAGLAWPWILRRIDAATGLAIASACGAFTLAAMAAIPRGPAAAILVTTLLTTTMLVSTGADIAPPVITAAAADVDEARSGSNQLGAFTAATVLSQKLGIALGGGFALLLLGSFGFDPKAANGGHAMTGFALTIFIIPALCNLGGAYAAFCLRKA